MNQLQHPSLHFPISSKSTLHLRLQKLYTKNRREVKKNIDKNYLLRFTYYWVVNVILFSLAYAFYPQGYEISNINIPVVPATIFSAFLFTTLTCLARGCAKVRNITDRGQVFIFFYYWAASSFAVWIVARMADISGFGVAKYTWAIGLGLVAAFVHWRVRQSLKGMKLI